MTGRATTNSGYTLVELMIAMMIGGAILAVAGTITSGVIASNSAAADHLHGVAALADLGHVFRGDVHATTRAAAGPPLTLALTLADASEIKYEVSAAGVSRTRAVDGKAVSQEAFHLRGMRVLGFKANDPSGQIAIVVGRAVSRPGEDDLVVGQFEISAVAPGKRARESNP